ncbi:hypothetical protein SAMN05421664_2974 [Chryseobacterium soldanellicola]|uniref:Uncharacterized protein n=1 Tax=Chryseobacterium soldanellicola TaxID=311333 RepID=A0A1H1FBD7_9FLAO|nr:hypothetical protein SAMN05421664_2974 [Chryseobacterium soldanellicola]
MNILICLIQALKKVLKKIKKCPKLYYSNVFNKALKQIYNETMLLLLHKEMQKMSQLSPKEMQETADAHMNRNKELAVKEHLISGDGLHEKEMLIKEKTLP